MISEKLQLISASLRSSVGHRITLFVIRGRTLRRIPRLGLFYYYFSAKGDTNLQVHKEDLHLNMN